MAPRSKPPCDRAPWSLLASGAGMGGNPQNLKAFWLDCETPAPGGQNKRNRTGERRIVKGAASSQSLKMHLFSSVGCGFL